MVDPAKAIDLHKEQRDAFTRIHQAITQKRIEPFISESILTYESLVKERRQQVLSHKSPLKITTGENKIHLESNPAIHPGLQPKDVYYFKKAIELGFKVLPGRRFGKLVIPEVQQAGHYIPDEDYLEGGKRFAEITDFIQSKGCGYAVYHQLTCPPELAHLNVPTRLQLYKGTAKKLSSALAEWSDGDSVALHITNHIDLFCSNDNAKNTKTKSVFHPDIVQQLTERYDFKKVSPAQLMELL
ncbi:MAG: hypothetical protein V4539_16600 [Bacteroidota bacterium]